MTFQPPFSGGIAAQIGLAQSQGGIFNLGNSRRQRLAQASALPAAIVQIERRRQALKDPDENIRNFQALLGHASGEFSNVAQKVLLPLLPLLTEEEAVEVHRKLLNTVLAVYLEAGHIAYPDVDDLVSTAPGKRMANGGAL